MKYFLDEVLSMVRFLYFMVEGVARIHDKLLQINDSSALFLTDKQLHFAVMGLLGMGLLLVIYPLFLLLSKRHVLTIAWIYVFTVMVMLSFAIEIGQGITDTGNMDLEDVISGLAGFMLLFIIFAILRMIFIGIRNLLFPENR
jgi:glycopeptide antibiotics resistance protein